MRAGRGGRDGFILQLDGTGAHVMSELVGSTGDDLIEGLAFDETGGAQYPNMARYARLALPEDLRHFAHRQLHRAEQAHDSQARPVRQSPKDRLDVHAAQYKDICKSVNRLVCAQFGPLAPADRIRKTVCKTEC